MYRIKSNSKITNNPTFNIVLGGVYQVDIDTQIIVESFTPYDSEGKLLGSEDYAIYHAICRKIVNNEYGPSDIEENVRLSPELISYNYKYTGMSFIKC